MEGSPEEVAVRTSLVTGFTGSVLGATFGPPGAIAGGLTFGTAGYAFGYYAADQRGMPGSSYGMDSI